MKFLGLDYQRTFQNLIDSHYSRDKFKFGYTDTQRTEASYKAFVEGLFGPAADSIIETSPETNQSILLRAYDKCPEFEKQSEKAKGPNSEFDKFQQSEIYKKMALEVSSRLGYKYPLNPKQIDTMWDMCRFDQAWYLQDDSAWCAAFTPKHVDVLEYLEDLKYYYKSGYGSELNSKIMCAAVKDMVKNLKDEGDPKVVAYFSHASAIQLFLTALGYGKDSEPLTADNFNVMKYRKFRTSSMSPLGGNLVAVKYE